MRRQRRKARAWSPSPAWSGAQASLSLESLTQVSPDLLTQSNQILLQDQDGELRNSQDQ